MECWCEHLYINGHLDTDRIYLIRVKNMAEVIWNVFNSAGFTR